MSLVAEHLVTQVCESKMTRTQAAAAAQLLAEQRAVRVQNVNDPFCEEMEELVVFFLWLEGL